MRCLIISLLLLTGSAYAGPLEFCNDTSADSADQSFYQPLQSYRGQVALTGTGLAPSITLPALTAGMRTLRIDFQNRNDYLSCLDAAAPNNWCGTNPPTGTISNTAWVFKPASIKVRKISNTIPTVMYISGSTGVTGYSMCGMP